MSAARSFWLFSLIVFQNRTACLATKCSGECITMILTEVIFLSERMVGAAAACTVCVCQL